jgi:hypothetical protein
MKHHLNNFGSIDCIKIEGTIWLWLYSRQLFSWSIGRAKGLFVQDVYWWNYIWIWFGLTNATMWWFAKCVDDVLSHEACSSINNHGLSCLWPDLL